MRLQQFISLILILVSFFNNTFSQDNSWVLKKDRKGITIYTRTDKATGFVEFKSTTTIETTIPKILEMFYHVDSYTSWMSDTKFAKVLQQVNKDESYLLLEVDMPWPLQNRDMPIHQLISKTDSGAEISIVGVPNYTPISKGVTRIEKAEATWTLTNEADNKVNIVYRFLADPGLNFPNWVIAIFIVDGPYETLTNLKNQVNK